MQAEIGLAIILIIVLLADLFQKVPSPKNMQRLSCALLVILLLNNLFNSASGEAFGSMYINTPMTSVVKTVLTLGTVEQHNGGTVDRDAYNGFYKTNPKLSFVMTIALFSLAGIPPFAGFFSKFFVFASAFHAGHWLVVFLALVNTIISLYYYLLVVKAMYIVPNETPLATFKSSATTRACLFICLMGIILLGVCSSVYQIFTEVAAL
jgi:NADH-quinone oxidoreductase subunit N